jgi:Fe-S cluster assembly iron-binding protein IscA
MLEVSANAATYVDAIRRRFELPASTGLRIWIDRAADSNVKVGFSDRPGTDDEVVESAGGRIFVAAELADALDGHTLDVQTDADPPALTLRRHT